MWRLGKAAFPQAAEENIKVMKRSSAISWNQVKSGLPLNTGRAKKAREQRNHDPQPMPRNSRWQTSARASVKTSRGETKLVLARLTERVSCVYTGLDDGQKPGFLLESDRRRIWRDLSESLPGLHPHLTWCNKRVVIGFIFQSSAKRRP